MSATLEMTNKPMYVVFWVQTGVGTGMFSYFKTMGSIKSTHFFGFCQTFVFDYSTGLCILMAEMTHDRCVFEFPHAGPAAPAQHEFTKGVVSIVAAGPIN